MERGQGQVTMKVLITGAAGFVGRHVASELRQNGDEPVLYDKVPVAGTDPSYVGDLEDLQSLRACVEQEQPDACIHLAGIAFVPAGWSDPARMIQVNVTGTLNLLETFRAHAPRSRILVISSAEVYGRSARPEPIRESDSLTPSNLYAVSKIAADTSALLYHSHYGMEVMTARPQNHIGPGQARQFVVSAFAEQLIALRTAKGSDPRMKVGNLESQRDFTDVRDVARAYRLLLRQGHAGEAYNIASGHMVPIRVILDHLCHHAGIHPRLEIDADLFRPTDQPSLLSMEKIFAHTGWAPSIPLEQSLADVFDAIAGAAL